MDSLEERIGGVTSFEPASAEVAAAYAIHLQIASIFANVEPTRIRTIMKLVVDELVRGK